MEDKQSFITEARREQIIKAAIEVLKEIGYVNTSLAKIARKANISTGLISYHFSGKEDLMNNTLIYLIEQEWLFVNKRVAQQSTWTEKLIAFIEANLAYQVLNLANSIALIEIVFNARTSDQIPYYLLEDDEEDLKASLLKEILFKGQETNEFGGDFNPEVVSTIIQGAISETMLSPQNKHSHEEYSLELTKGVLKIVK
ncbi:TetR/AcrR family transcriptional regulator [Desulfosporosinus lacus]|uniref:Transcriptional regulator, TetR family n=1 Tax=Desulfosporosinus lacus DSM 15449 TaxID=1121420 RepID=A0A1M5V7S9_9FIRM|nr:TetR/AcrR family transcriptional regulator [Desulfosporosinus lacus]SHH71287.1 transcriptional regulator, TetR family [Desulfosporosinus lacus DSM 15449]